MRERPRHHANAAARDAEATARRGRVSLISFFRVPHGMEYNLASEDVVSEAILPPAAAVRILGEDAGQLRKRINQLGIALETIFGIRVRTTVLPQRERRPSCRPLTFWIEQACGAARLEKVRHPGLFPGGILHCSFEFVP